MVLLLLGDSQVERVWPTVRLDRELLQDAIFSPVKNRASIVSGFRSMTASVRRLFDSLVSPTSLCYLIYTSRLLGICRFAKFCWRYTIQE